MYKLIDSGEGQKLEQFGPYLLVRPCAAAIWKPQLSAKEWENAHAFFSREEGPTWQWRQKPPHSWVVECEGLKFKLIPTDFGHLGIFPEHRLLWSWAEKQAKGARVLNLFAYSGAATLACARGGAEVCHLDASKAAVSWARENAALNGLEDRPIRWIIDDIFKFLKREITRGRRYDGILLDPPSFGRGAQGEVFKIERDLPDLLSLCRQLLSENPRFVAFSSHTPTMTPLVMNHLLEEMMKGCGGKIESGELTLDSESSRALPSGSFARWRP